MVDAGEPGAAGVVGGGSEEFASGLTSEQVWRQIAKASFAVVSYVTPAGEPRSSGVTYAVSRQRLYVVVAPDSWKARHIAAGERVAVTVTVRRGGILTLLMPIPPATVSFHGAAVVHPEGELEIPTDLAKVVPAERLVASRIIEIVPEGYFVTYGLGVSLLQMRNPEIARARLPVA